MANIFDDLLKRQHWPIKPTHELAFYIDRNPLVAACEILALVAYPTAFERQEGGPAHRFAVALLADKLRLARTHGKLATIPDWVRKQRLEAIRNRIRRGHGRLAYRLTAIQTIFEAGGRAEERRAHLNGEKPTFSLRLSPDFTKLEIAIPFHKEPDTDQIRLTGVVPEARASSLRAAILYHREAFGMGKGDPQEEYVNIYNRYMKPMLPVFNLALLVWDAWMSKAESARERRLQVWDILTRQPGWAERAWVRALEEERSALLILGSAGVPTCSCRFLKLT